MFPPPPSSNAMRARARRRRPRPPPRHSSGSSLPSLLLLISYHIFAHVLTAFFSNAKCHIRPSLSVFSSPRRDDIAWHRVRIRLLRLAAKATMIFLVGGAHGVFPMVILGLATLFLVSIRNFVCRVGRRTRLGSVLTSAADPSSGCAAHRPPPAPTAGRLLVLVRPSVRPWPELYQVEEERSGVEWSD